MLELGDIDIVVARIPYRGDQVSHFSGMVVEGSEGFERCDLGP